MDHGEFLALIVTPQTPELQQFERVAAFTHHADKAMLWEALGRSGLHPFYRNLLTQALHQRVIEEIEHEREQAHERLRALQDGEAARQAQEQEPPRRRRVR